mgnify:FL=1|tara:strand:- start:34 stop:834 length:801 start_codon:yes stop_codon:yes gene_type:complete
MKKILIIILLIICNNAFSKNYSGFVVDKDNNVNNLKPISKSYKGKTPDINLNNASELTIIIFSHGTTRPQKRENCKKKYNAIPKSLLVLKENTNTFFYYLCSKATDGGVAGSYINKRVKEIDNVLNQLIAAGVKPENIFLSGVSAGAWSSLMIMDRVDEKFNSAIVFAPACCGRRSEINQYPKWRKQIRPKQVKKMIEAKTIKALIFAYEDDKFNRPKELIFLKEKYSNSVNLVSYKCGKGHNTYEKDCKLEETKNIIRNYVKKQK